MTFVRSLSVAFPTVVLVSLLAAQTNSAVKQVDLTFTTIDVPGGYVLNNVSGINSDGDMVGSYNATDSALGSHGFLYSGGSFAFFDYPAAQSTLGWSINDSGLIVGSAYFHGGLIVHGFLYDGQGFATFDVPQQPQTYPFGINNAGDVVGGAGSAGAFLKAFEMHNSRFKLVQVPGHSSTEVASAINDLGQMAAYSSDGLTQYGYLEGSGRPKRLMVPGADATRAQGINNGGVVVGVYFVGGNCYGFAYRNGKYLSFNYPGALCTGAEAINTSGQIVGQYTLDYERYHGFVTQLPTSMFKD